jgi:hypothetical protein
MSDTKIEKIQEVVIAVKNAKDAVAFYSRTYLV